MSLRIHEDDSEASDEGSELETSSTIKNGGLDEQEYYILRYFESPALGIRLCNEIIWGYNEIHLVDFLSLLHELFEELIDHQGSSVF